MRVYELNTASILKEQIMSGILTFKSRATHTWLYTVMFEYHVYIIFTCFFIHFSSYVMHSCFSSVHMLYSSLCGVYLELLFRQ